MFWTVSTCTVHPLRSTFCTPYLTLYLRQSILHTLDLTLRVLQLDFACSCGRHFHFALCICVLRRPLLSAFYVLHSALCTWHSAVYMWHFSWHTLHSALHFALYALHSTLHTPSSHVTCWIQIPHSTPHRRHISYSAFHSLSPRCGDTEKNQSTIVEKRHCHVSIAPAAGCTCQQYVTMISNLAERCLPWFLLFLFVWRSTMSWFTGVCFRCSDMSSKFRHIESNSPWHFHNKVDKIGRGIHQNVKPNASKCRIT